MYGPEKFMDYNNVIMVTFNYRLSTLGWMTLDYDEHVGNQGLYDILTALKWVQTNIGSFGGDPGQVTIFGESAGSWSCSYLIVSPMAQGLFHRAILQSGSWNSPSWYAIENEKAMNISKYSAEKLNCLK